MNAKNDKGKARWDLMPLDIIEDIVMTLNFGVEKYGANTWQSLPDSQNRYFSAALRH